MKVGSGMAAVYSNYIGKNDIDNFPASGYTLKELLRLRMWRNGRRTSLRSWRATVQVRVLSPALNQGFITVNWQFCHLPQQAV